jgi:hypothetical protein
VAPSTPLPGRVVDVATEMVPAVSIERRIRLIRGQKVLLDLDLARL